MVLSTILHIREFLLERSPVSDASGGEPSGESGGLEGSSDSVFWNSVTQNVTWGNLHSRDPALACTSERSDESEECGKTSPKTFTNQHQEIHPSQEQGRCGGYNRMQSGHNSLSLIHFSAGKIKTWTGSIFYCRYSWNITKL